MKNKAKMITIMY